MVNIESVVFICGRRILRRVEYVVVHCNLQAMGIYRPVAESTLVGRCYGRSEN